MLIDYNQIVSTFSRPFPSSFCRSGWTSVGRWMSWATWNNVRRLGGLTWDSPGDGGYKTHGKPMENLWKTYKNLWKITIFTMENIWKITMEPYKFHGKHTKTYGKSQFLLGQSTINGNVEWLCWISQMVDMGVVLKWRQTWMVYFMENPIESDDLGVPPWIGNLH